MRALKLVVAILIVLASGSANLSTAKTKEPALPQNQIGKELEIKIDPKTGEYSTVVSVLSYNIAALPWPLLENRNGPIKAIGRVLGEMREAGTAPDIVFIQEGFRSSTRKLIKASGYPNWVMGPKRKDKADETESFVSEQYLKGRKFFKGEKLGRIMNSGLYILSEFPIESKIIEPFFKGACAGFDCGANKGILWSKVRIPGVPDSIQLMTTHLNSRGASGVSEARSLEAHNLQVAQIFEFFGNHWDRNLPLIYGGDFNVKNSQDRAEFVLDLDRQNEQGEPDITPSWYCSRTPNCDYRIPVDDEKLALEEKQDWQGMISGSDVKLTPIAVDHMFHEESVDGYSIRGRNTLSDHDGLLVLYKITWKPKSRPRDH